MPTQRPFFAGNATVTAAATAVSILALIQGEGFQPTGACVSLNITFDANVYLGWESSVTNTDGGLIPANTPVTDSAVGALSDNIPISQMFFYKQAAGDANCVIYARFIP